MASCWRQPPKLVSYKNVPVSFARDARILYHVIASALSHFSAMRRNPPRASSPTPTAFSGISNYRSESYRTKDASPASSQPDGRAIAQIHFEELSRFLADYLARGAFPLKERIQGYSSLIVYKFPPTLDQPHVKN